MHTRLARKVDEPHGLPSCNRRVTALSQNFFVSCSSVGNGTCHIYRTIHEKRRDVFMFLCHAADRARTLLSNSRCVRNGNLNYVRNVAVACAHACEDSFLS